MAGDPNVSNFWVGIIAAAILTCSTAYGLRTGRTRLFRREVSRRDDRYQFWLAICLSAAVAIAALLLALSDLL